MDPFTNIGKVEIGVAVRTLATLVALGGCWIERFVHAQQMEPKPATLECLHGVIRSTVVASRHRVEDAGSKSLGLARDQRSLILDESPERKVSDQEFSVTIIPPFESAAGGDLMVSVGGDHGRNVEFRRLGQSYVFRPKEGTVLSNPVVESGGRRAFLVVHKMDGFRREYVSLIRFDITIDGQVMSGVTEHYFLSLRELETIATSTRCWVSSLYKVSKSGRHLLLEIVSEQSADNRSEKYLMYRQMPYWFNMSDQTLTSIDEPCKE